MAPIPEFGKPLSHPLASASKKSIMSATSTDAINEDASNKT
ncbi:MAG TPA: hypothetical protein VFY64_06890 [Nitrososphaeraceae archaeon]|nr:hypothetical protein [Nitrososphaeraceae archaeon]